MTGELTSRCVADSRPSRSNHHHHQLLHSTKTDEIEILESGGGGGGEEHHETKVSSPTKLLLLLLYCVSQYRTHNIFDGFTSHSFVRIHSLLFQTLISLAKIVSLLTHTLTVCIWILHMARAANEHTCGQWSEMEWKAHAWTLYFSAAIFICNLCIYDLHNAHAVVDNKAHDIQCSHINTVLMGSLCVDIVCRAPTCSLSFTNFRKQFTERMSERISRWIMAK